MIYEEDKFIIKDENGEEKEFYKMITFSSSITNKTYLIYTDNKYTDGKLNIYSSIIKGDSDNIEFVKITDETDKNEVNKALLQFKISV